MDASPLFYPEVTITRKEVKKDEDESGSTSDSDKCETLPNDNLGDIQQKLIRIGLIRRLQELSPSVSNNVYSPILSIPNPSNLYRPESVSCSEWSATGSATPPLEELVVEPDFAPTSDIASEDSDGSGDASQPKHQRIQKADPVLSGRRCKNCSADETPLWRRDVDGQHVCNACGLYKKVNGVDRPTVKTKNSRVSTSRRRDLTCTNCLTKNTTLWRRRDGAMLCNACGLYAKVHQGAPRPTSLKKDTIQTRNRKMNRKSRLEGDPGCSFQGFSHLHDSSSSSSNFSANNFERTVSFEELIKLE